MSVSGNNRNQDCIRSTGLIQIYKRHVAQNFKRETREFNHNILAIVQLSYFVCLHCGDSGGNCNAESSTRQLQMPRRWYHPVCLFRSHYESSWTVDSSQRGTNATTKHLQAEGWASHGPSVGCLETIPRRQWVITGEPPIPQMPLAIPLTLLFVSRHPHHHLMLYDVKWICLRVRMIQLPVVVDKACFGSGNSN